MYNVQLLYIYAEIKDLSEWWVAEIKSHYIELIL